MSALVSSRKVRKVSRVFCTWCYHSWCVRRIFQNSEPIFMFSISCLQVPKGTPPRQPPPLPPKKQRSSMANVEPVRPPSPPPSRIALLSTSSPEPDAEVARPQPVPRSRPESPMASPAKVRRSKTMFDRTRSPDSPVVVRRLRL